MFEMNNAFLFRIGEDKVMALHSELSTNKPFISLSDPN
jgi:hypothetical protein